MFLMINNKFQMSNEQQISNDKLNDLKFEIDLDFGILLVN